MKKLLLFFAFFISLNTLAVPEVFRDDEGMLYVENVKNNKKEGKYIYYTNDGDREEGTYKNGKKEGPYIGYLKDGSREEGTYKNGIPEGPYIGYLKDGSREEGIYKNGKKIKLR